MEQPLLFGRLLRITYAASEAAEPIERYFASMFAGYYDQIDSQPGSAAVNAIIRGNRAVPRKLLHYYRDPEHPRCPPRLAEDLAALADCFFSDAVRRSTLRQALEAFLQELPAEDAQDLRSSLCREDLVQMWTYLTWYALCGDHYGTASY